MIIDDSLMKDALATLRKWCAIQERCQQESFFKMRKLGLTAEQSEQAIGQLISEGFINEERFARTFARGKFRIKKWGRRKILFELKKKKISEYCIRRALQEIDGGDYQYTLNELIRKKSKDIKDGDLHVRNRKLASFLISKGFESELVREALHADEE
ncbi:MAG: regulatory protein RecX [Bacteroidota bacterium]